MPVSLGETFGPADRPLGTVRIGDRDVPVMPITFAKFQRLLALDHGALLGEGDVVSNFASLSWTLVQILLPGVSEDEWRAAEARTFLPLYALFAEGHDWEVVFDGLGFNDDTPVEEVAQRYPQTQGEVVSGLLAFCRANPGYSISDLVELRVDAFYSLMRAASEEAAARGRPVEEATIPPSMPIVKDPDRSERFRQMFAEADARGSVADA